MVGSARLCVHDEISSAPDGYMFEGLISMSSRKHEQARGPEIVQGIWARPSVRHARIKFARSFGVRTVIATPVDKQPRRAALASLGFVMTDRVGTAIWSNNVSMRASYLISRGDYDRPTKAFDISHRKLGLMNAIVSGVCVGIMLFEVHSIAGIVSASEVTFLRAIFAMLILPAAHNSAWPFVAGKGFFFALGA